MRIWKAVIVGMALLAVGRTAQAQDVEDLVTYEAAVTQLDVEENAIIDEIAAPLNDLVIETQFDPSCNPYVAAFAQATAMRSRFLNLYADAVGSYCAAAEGWIALNHWYSVKLEEIHQRQIVRAYWDAWIYNRFWWRFFV